MSILGFFKRIPKWTPQQGDGSTFGVWRRGDLAVCIAASFTLYDNGEKSKACPQKGDVLRVTDVGMEEGYHSLRFADWPGEWFTASSFRKAVIDKAEQCEPEFVTLLNRIKRKQFVPAQGPEAQLATTAIAGEARSGETVQQGSTGTASTRAEGIAQTPYPNPPTPRTD